jgi:hypothetical protein
MEEVSLKHDAASTSSASFRDKYEPIHACNMYRISLWLKLFSIFLCILNFNYFMIIMFPIFHTCN